MRSLASLRALVRLAAVHSIHPMKGVSLARAKRWPLPVRVVMRANRKDRAAYIVIADKDKGGPCFARSVTALHFRKLTACHAPCEREGTVAQHREHCWPAIHYVRRVEKHLRGFRRDLSRDSAEPMTRTEPCNTPRFSIRRAHDRERATSREQFALRASRKRRNDAPPGRATSACDSTICAGSHSTAYGDAETVVNRVRSSAPELPERRKGPAQRRDSVRSALIRDRAVCGIHGWIRRTIALVEKCYFRWSKNPWSRGVGAISFWLPTTERAAGRKPVQGSRAKIFDSKQVARSEHRHHAPYGHRAPSALRAQRFPLRPTRRRLGRIAYEDWRSDSIARVRRLPGNFLKTWLGIRAAAGCCSWNLPALVRSRLGEKRKRKVECEVRASMVPPSRYLRKGQKSGVNLRAAAHCTSVATLVRATSQQRRPNLARAGCLYGGIR